MNPVCFQIVNEENDTAEGPGDGIGPGNGGEAINQPNCDENIAHAEQAPAAQHGEHGDRGLAGSP